MGRFLLEKIQFLLELSLISVSLAVHLWFNRLNEHYKFESRCGHRRKRVLLVDDEPGLLLFAGEVLRDAGYDVVTGDDGNVALSLVRSQPFDLMIIDLVMPEREGLDTMMRLRESHPALLIVAISGAFGGRFLHSASMLGARATLAKPFSAEDLLNVVRTVLGG